MSGIQSYVSPGFGEFVREHMHYVQAVRIGDVIKCSGQGGWDAENTDIKFETLIPTELGDEIDAAFAAADYNLRHTGGKGFSQVYKIVTYSTDLPATHEHIVRNLKKWMPDHPPIWTELGVKELGAPTMHFEIDVEAYDPQPKA